MSCTSISLSVLCKWFSFSVHLVAAHSMWDDLLIVSVSHEENLRDKADTVGCDLSVRICWVGSEPVSTLSPCLFTHTHTGLNLLWAILARWSRFTQEILLRGLGVLKTTMMLTGRPDLGAKSRHEEILCNPRLHTSKTCKPWLQLDLSPSCRKLLTLTCQVCLVQTDAGDTCWRSGSPPPSDGSAYAEPDTSPETLWCSDSDTRGGRRDGPVRSIITYTALQHFTMRQFKTT